jgi:pimeloyl-ACP methyl ester carboxylesterase
MIGRMNASAFPQRKGYVDAPTGQVHYRMMGEGTPVVLLHQTAWSSIQYKNALPFLARAGLRAIALDTPGYGQSDGFDHQPTVPEYAAVLPAVFDELGLATAAVAGHHTGATIAAAFAARYPQRVSRCVLHGAPIFSPEERAERLSRPHFDQTPQPDGSHLTRRWDVAQKGSPTASLDAIQMSLLTFFLTGATEYYGHIAVWSYDSSADFKAIKAPTLLVTNEGDAVHKMVPRMRALRPDFAVAEMKGGTHHVVFDEAEAWTKIVADFLKAGG